MPPVEKRKTSGAKKNESNGVEDNQCNCNDYFANKKRKFQAIIKGRFKTPFSMSRCVTGQTFERPAGKLPARWLVSRIIKFISILAPQLDASLDGEKPRFLSPLLATTQTVLSEEDDAKESWSNPNIRNTYNILHSSRDDGLCLKIDTAVHLEEPSSLDPSSVLSNLRAQQRDLSISVPDTTSSSVTSRTVARKKVFNALSAIKSSEPRFDCDRIYTFEFYQHLIEFSQFAVDMGKIGGMIPLAQASDGQPLKIMAAYRESEENQELDLLWSFDIFHESLYPYVESALAQNR